MEKFHYERMDKKPEAAQKCSLIKIYLAMGKGTRFFIQTGKMDPGFIKELKPIPKPTKSFLT